MRRIKATLTACLLAAGLTAGLAAQPAHASTGTGNQWAYSTSPWGLINAWDNGPWIKNYYGGQPTTANDDFTNIVLSPTTNHAMEFTGLNGGWCIGDAFNDPNDARASSGSCGSGGRGENWGVDMTIGTSGCPSGWYWIHDVHWNGYLGPAGNSNGSQFYLNKPNKICYEALGPA